MLYELIRTIVQKILQDKILLGLVIVAFLGIFVGGMTMGDEKTDSKSAKSAGGEPLPPGATPDGQPQAAVPQPAVPTQGQAQGQAGGQALTPQLACDFISWWLNSAMDYNAATASQNHNQALAWMTPDAGAAFTQSFWNPQISEAVTTGRLVAAFQPTGVQAQAINPDGSVVVGVSGTMVVQSGGQPVPQQFLAAFLVKRDQDGMRVSGVNARTGVLPGSSVY